MNEELMKKLFDESEELLDGVMKQVVTYRDISKMTSGELEMFRKMMNIYNTFKEVSLSMAKTLDRQDEVLKRLDEYLDYQDHLERQNKY